MTAFFPRSLCFVIALLPSGLVELSFAGFSKPGATMRIDRNQGWFPMVQAGERVVPLPKSPGLAN